MQLHGAYEQIRSRGAELVVVGNGTVWHAQGFRDEHGIPFPLVVDPDLKAYAAAGLRRSKLDALRPSVLLNALRAHRSGSAQTATKGDVWQLGGTFVVAPGGRVVFRHVSRAAGDHPDVEEVIRSIPARPAGEGLRQAS